MHRTHARNTLKLMAALMVVLLVESRASAFYWRGWPGGSSDNERTLIEPPGIPPGTPFPPPVEIDTPFPPIGPPQQTPEPASAVMGIVGLATLAVGRWARKKSD